MDTHPWLGCWASLALHHILPTRVGTAPSYIHRGLFKSKKQWLAARSLFTCVQRGWHVKQAALSLPTRYLSGGYSY